MKNAWWLRSFVCLLLMAPTGCATVATVQRSQGQGISRSYPYPFAVTFESARDALQELGIEIVEVMRSPDGHSGSIIGKKSLSLFSYGERIAVFVSTQNERSTQVEVVSKRVLATNVFAKDWTQDILSTIANVLAHRQAMGKS